MEGASLECNPLKPHVPRHLAFRHPLLKIIRQLFSHFVFKPHSSENPRMLFHPKLEFNSWNLKWRQCFCMYNFTCAQNNILFTFIINFLLKCNFLKLYLTINITVQFHSYQTVKFKLFLLTPLISIIQSKQN